jgi:hypothetical protein
MGGTLLRENADFARTGTEMRCVASFSCSLQKLGYDGTLRMSNMTGSIAIIIACSLVAMPTRLGFCSVDVGRTKRIGFRWTDGVELPFFLLFLSRAA